MASHDPAAGTLFARLIARMLRYSTYSAVDQVTAAHPEEAPMPRPAGSQTQITSSSPRTQVPALHPPCPLDEPRRGLSMRYHVTVTLLAARQEEDNAIHLRIASPLEPKQSTLVCFPESSRDLGGQPSGQHRFRAARQSFIENFLMPPFEGFALLYGTARLTLVDKEPAQTAEEDAARLCVMDFEALDDGA